MSYCKDPASDTGISEKQKIKVSIITTSFNSQKTIARTIDSVNRQSYGEIEHLVIDGGSQDGTLEIVASNKQRPGVVISEPDSGIYDAMNKGLSRATGDVICFLNSDDIYCSDFLIEGVVDYFCKSNVDLIYGDVIYESSSGRQVRYYSSKKFTFERLKNGLMPAHPSLFVRAKTYERIGKFRPEFRIAGDFEMCCRLFKNRSFQAKYLEKPFVKMLTGGASSFSFTKVLLVNQEIKRACLINDIQTSYGQLFLRYFAKVRELVGVVS